MNDMPKIAAIITPDSRGNISRDTIDSIIAQTLKPRRLIVVYDRSQAETIVALQDRIKVAMPTSQLQYIEHNPDATFVAARNDGLNHVCDCRYIHFVNSDIRLPEDFYEKATRDLMKRTDCAVAMPARLKLMEAKEREIDLGNFIKNPWLWLMRSKLEIVSAMLLCRDAVDEAGKFNPTLVLGADIDFLARIVNQGAGCCIADCVASHILSQSKADLLSQFPDHHRRWALIYENILDTYGARHRVARKTYRSILAKAWCRAGRQLLTHERVEEARDCFMRSLSWRLINPSFKYLIRLPRLRKEMHSSENCSIDGK